MATIQFELITNHYYLKKVETMVACILANFLTSDVGHYATDWIKFANDQTRPYTSSNASFVDKDDNNILIGDILSEAEDWGPFFVVTKENFIKLLEDWDKLIRQKPSQIFLTIHDDGAITLEGSND